MRQALTAASPMLALIVAALLGLFGSPVARAQGVPGLSMSPGLFTPGITPMIGTWNPSDKFTNVVLSNGNLTARTSSSVGGGGVSVRSTNSVSAGKYYFEMTSGPPNTGLTLGIANSSANLGGFCGVDANGLGLNVNGNFYRSASVQGAGATFTSGDVLGATVEYNAGDIIFTVYKNGTLAGAVTISDWGASFICGSVDLNNGMILNQQPLYQPPAGFTVWGN